MSERVEWLEDGTASGAPYSPRFADRYRSELGVDDLVLDINGNPMPLESMAGELLTLPLDLSMLMTMADR